MEPEDFDPTDDAAIEAAQRAEDGEEADTNPVTEDEPTGQVDDPAAGEGAAAALADPEAAAAAVVEAAAGAEPTAEAQAAAAAEASEKVQGVASKDGSRVLPYSALQAERRNARKASADRDRAVQEATDLRQQLDDFKAGKKPAADGLTEEELAEIEANFPEQAAKMRSVIAREQELAAKTTAAKAEPDDQDGDSPIQEAIDSTPLLFEWQHKDAEKFSRAIAIDNVVQNSPKWKDKPLADRFAHVARMVAEEYDIEVPPTKAPPAAAAPAPKPAAAAKAAAASAMRPPPNTLSDFKGGTVAEHGSVNYEKMAPQTMLGRYSDMTDAEIDAQLARLG